MNKQEVQIEWKTIIIKLDEGRHFGAWFENYVTKGLKKGYTHGKFVWKHSKNVVWKWKIKESVFIKLWRTLNK